MYEKVAWIGLLLTAATGLAEERPAASPGSSLPPSGRPVVPSPEGAKQVPDGAGWQRDLAQLKAEREALEAERARTSQQPARASSATDDQMAQLRLRINQLLTQMAIQSAKSRSSPPEPPTPTRVPVTVTMQPLPPGPPPPPAPAPQPAPPKASALAQSNEPEIPIPVELNRPVDALALAQTLFRTDDYAGALRAYRLLDPASLTAENRLTVQYMIACCLRNLGKLEEASTLYREVANSKGDEVLVDCAQWQLTAIQWRQQLHAELEQIRQRRKTWEAKP